MFVVLSGYKVLRKFIKKDGFKGGIFIEKKNKNFNVNIKNVNKNVRFVYVENKPVFLKFLAENLKYLHDKKLMIFETFDSEKIKFFDKKETLILINKYLSKLLSNNIVLKYQEISQKTFGEITFEDSRIISNLILFHGLINKKYLTALEIGSWLGCSSYFIAKSLLEISLDSKLFCIDTWKGSTGVSNHNIANYIDIFGQFKGLMEYYNVYNIIKPFMVESDVAFEIIKNDKFDVIFIDGDHRYEKVKNDILNAVLKIKPGGLLIGHDCECYCEELPRDFVNNNSNKDYTFYKDKGFHCGVIKALGEIFGNKYEIGKNSSVWYKNITFNDKNEIINRFK